MALSKIPKFFILLLLLLLLLLAVMTYNQVQSFQINEYENNYVDIEITRYRALYSKSIAGRGVARLISWLGTARPVDCFNKSVSDCYIRVNRFLKILLTANSQLLVGSTLGYTPKMETQLIFKILEVIMLVNWNAVNKRNLLQIQLIIHFHSRSKTQNCYQK